MFIRRLFGASAKTASYWDADDSGIAAQPRKGSSVPPEYRVHFWTAHASQTFLSGSHLQALNEQFTIALESQLSARGIEDQWVEYPDLYAFLQSVVGRCATDTVLGPRLLGLNPELLDDFQVYDKNLVKILYGRPRWLARAGYQARDRLRKAIEKWQTDETHNEAGTNIGKTAAEDLEFDGNVSSKFFKSRNASMNRMGLDSHDKASLDLGLMFAFVHFCGPGQ